MAPEAKTPPEERPLPAEYVQCVGRRRIYVDPYNDPEQGKVLFLHIYLKEKRLATLRLLPEEVQKLQRLLSAAVPGGLGRLLGRGRLRL